MWVVPLGMAFGTGSAVAHRAVDAVMGPRTIQHETVSQAPDAAVAPVGNTGADSCNIHSRAFQDVSDSFCLFLFFVSAVADGICYQNGLVFNAEVYMAMLIRF